MVLPVWMQSSTSWAARVGPSQIMRIARRDDRQPHPLRDVEGASGAFLLNSHAVVLDLDVETLLAKHLLIPGAELLGLRGVAMED